MDFTNVLPGVSTVLNSNNIAIVVLMVMLSLSVTMNYYLIGGILKMKDVFYSLSLAISLLNERLGDHGEVVDKIEDARKEQNKNA